MTHTQKYPKPAAIPEIMPRDFAIYFYYAMNNMQPNILDTYEGTIQKDLINKGTASTKIIISAEDLNEIYSMIQEHEIYKIIKTMTSINLTTTDIAIAIDPCTKYEIMFTINGIDYNVCGDDTAYEYTSINNDAENFCSFIEYMKQYLRSTEEYISLPEAEGGYV